MSVVFAVFGILVFSYLVRAQDCDSFLCLRVFHDKFISGGNDAAVACRAAERYASCLQEAFDACTKLELLQQQVVADRMENYALCSLMSSACPACIQTWLISFLLLGAFVM